MLRSLILALVLAAPGAAMAQDGQFRESAIGAEVVSDTGEVVGRVEHVVRDANGRIIAAEIADQEPASAPYAPASLVASADPNMLLVADRRDDLRDRAPTRERQPPRAR